MATTASRPKIDTYAVARYIVVPTIDGEDGTAGNSNTERRKDQSAVAKLTRLKRRYDTEGHCVMSVEGVMVVHAHNHPHILLLKRSSASSSEAGALAPSSAGPTSQATFRLPGGKLRGAEAPADCLYRKLARDILGHRKPSGEEVEPANHVDSSDHPFVMGHSGHAALGSRGGGGDHSGVAAAQQAGIRVGEVLSVWCRPSFDRVMYPYIPAHVSEPKELRTLFLVHLPSECVLAVTEPNTELIAVPLFDLYENASKYGALIASIPQLLSRFVVNVC
jgi:cleavage and polyadenylation specificity factor subunit 5